METPIPANVAESQLSLHLLKMLKRQSHGKVRGSYLLPRPAHLLQHATDRASIFDFVLNSLVDRKGEILTAYTILMFTRVLGEFDNHLVAYGSGIDEFLVPQEFYERFYGIPETELQKSAVVVKTLSMMPVECIVRGYLAGTAWKDYQRDQIICGVKMPDGMHEGACFPEPIFTPDTKAESGHDEHILISEFRNTYGLFPEKLALAVYEKMSEYFVSRGLILADTKLEIGADCSGVLIFVRDQKWYKDIPMSPGFIIGDEAGTPDSSRIWQKNEYDEAQAKKKVPSSYDKQILRDWGKTVETPFFKDGARIIGINNLDATDPEHIKFVHCLTVPKKVLSLTVKRYYEGFSQFAGMTLEDFQREGMGIDV